MRSSIVLAVVAALLLAAFAARAQEDKAGPGIAPGRYHPAPGGVLDAWSGVLYFVDPEAPGEVVTLDLPRARAVVRDLGKDTSAGGAVDLPKLDPAVVPGARERLFAPTQNPHEVLDTKTGALYTLDAPPKKAVLDWKGVKVLRTDPVLGTRGVRDLAVSKRGA